MDNIEEDDEDDDEEFDQFRFGPRGLENTPLNPDEEEMVTPTAHNIEEQKSLEKKSRRSVVVGHKKAAISGHNQQPLPASREHQFYFDDQDEEIFFEELAQDFNRAQ